MKEFLISSINNTQKENDFLYITRVEEINNKKTGTCIFITGTARISGRLCNVWMKYYPNENFYEDAFGLVRVDDIDLKQLFFAIVPDMFMDKDTIFVNIENGETKWSRNGRMGMFYIKDVQTRLALLQVKNAIDTTSDICKTIKTIKTIQFADVSDDVANKIIRKKQTA